MGITNREIASLFWLGVFFFWALFCSSNRQELWGTLKSAIGVLFGKTISIVLVALSIYISLEILFFFAIGVWDNSLLKDTLLWSLVAFGSLLKIGDKGTFKEKLYCIAFRCFSLSFFLEYLANMSSFSLLAELIIFPFVASIVVCSVIAEHKDEHKILRKPLNIILAIYGTIVLFYTLHKIANDSSVVLLTELKKFTFPFALTALFIPFPYFFFLFCTYQTIFVILSFRIKNEKIAKAVKWKLFLHYKFNLFGLETWQKNGNVARVFTISDLENSLVKTGTSSDGV